MDVSEEQNVPDDKHETSSQQDSIVVHADEVDETGANLAAPKVAIDASGGLLTEEETPQDSLQGDKADAQAIDSSVGTIKQPVRPILRREASAPPPPPPRQPPPPAPPAQHEEGQLPTDSLSLGQLKNIVASLPKLEPIAYAYEYADTRTFPEELEEWFQYTEEDRDLVESSRTAFESRMTAFTGRNDQQTVQTDRQWLKTSLTDKKRFLKSLSRGIAEGNTSHCLECLQATSYLAMGAWYETVDETVPSSAEYEPDFEPPNQKYRAAVAQLMCVLESAELLCQSGILEHLIRVILHICDQSCAWHGGAERSSETAAQKTNNAEQVMMQQLDSAMTTVYFIIEAGRQQVHKHKSQSIRNAFVRNKNSILERLSMAIAKLRWDEDSTIPFTKVMLMLWKASLLIFGEASQIEDCKKAFRKPGQPGNIEDASLTTSPLDYHMFRQEITSKYPAYNPPPPLLPLEGNNNSILPPLPHHDSRQLSYDYVQGQSVGNGNGKSIFHQPVHIATPAPSPPPSPAGPGGKGGKKQNYQTNQNFPFLYPPLDSSSNDLGGKGKTEQQDKLVGKKWEGGDVPASILEAGQLFASRMRMTRALRQLWQVREEFIRSERGWQDETTEGVEISPDDSYIMEDSSDSSETKAEAQHVKAPKTGPRIESDLLTTDPAVRDRLALVETFFCHMLPHLQSVIIVLLKVLLSNVSVLGSANQADNGCGLEESISPEAMDGHLPQYNINLCRQLTDLGNGQRSEDDEVSRNSLKELNSTRLREITSKAITAYLLHLLKWLRLSHVLKFEYAVQLLVDSNYVPLALKYFALQDVDKAVDMKNDREDLDFFHLCHILSGRPESARASSASPRPPSSSSEDSAAPPPIARRRPSLPLSSSSSPPPSPGSPGSPQRRPEVDELGYPTTALPPQPLTSYAPRFFHTYISSLRLLQKLTKGHAHRALMLVQYKSSTILRKALKIPQPTLRLYTLKLFKTQVPYCGRKWRQANMRVITAIYVFCRMGLRDEWISGGGQVEEMVEGALGVESAWRGLVAWWLSRNYRTALAEASAKGDDLLTGKRVSAEDEDFFTRELEKMGWGMAGEVLEDEDGEWDEWDEGPIQLDGW